MRVFRGRVVGIMSVVVVVRFWIAAGWRAGLEKKNGLVPCQGRKKNNDILEVR